MHKVLFLLFLSFASLSFAQPGVVPTIEKQGKKYYQHTVEDGNTLWGMQRLYGVPYQEIVAANEPFDGLKTGEIVLVPVKGEVVEQAEVTSKYKAKTGETLYGLAKKFNTTVDHLIELNPELSEGLQKGQVILVPGNFTDENPVEVIEEPIQVTPNPFVIDTVQTNGQREERVVTFSDGMVQHVVMAHETMYSISKRFMVSIDKIMQINNLQSTNVKEGQILMIPVKSERVDKVPIGQVEEPKANGNEALKFDVKSEYAICLLLPLNLDYSAGYSEDLSDLAAQFYMGATMAVDSLQRKGLRAKIYVFDTKNDSLGIEKVLSQPEFAKMDLVIGPLMEERMTQVSTFCKEHQIRMVCPVTADAKILENNRLVYAAVPSNMALMRGMARYFLDNCQNDNIILVKPLDASSLPYYEAFKKALTELPTNGARPSLSETTLDGFGAYIRKGKKNHLVVPTAHRSTAVKFMNALNKGSFKSYGDEIRVYGTKEWINYTETNDAYKNKYNFRYPSPNNLDYYSKPMVEMNRAYRTRYKTDMSRVAVQAYDVLTYFCQEFFLNGKRAHLLMNDIYMEQVSEQDGYENTRIFIIEQEDYDLIEVGRATVKK